MTTSQSKCEICGHPMPIGEEMFKIHGYSGPCPTPIRVSDPMPSQSREDVRRDIEYVKSKFPGINHLTDFGSAIKRIFDFALETLDASQHKSWFCRDCGYFKKAIINNGDIICSDCYSKISSFKPLSEARKPETDPIHDYILKASPEDLKEICEAAGIDTEKEAAWVKELIQKRLAKSKPQAAPMEGVWRIDNGYLYNGDQRVTRIEFEVNPGGERDLMSRLNHPPESAKVTALVEDIAGLIKFIDDCPVDKLWTVEMAEKVRKVRNSLSHFRVPG